MWRWILCLMLCLPVIAAFADEKQNLDVGVAFDVQGQLWRAAVKQGQLWVDHSQPLQPGDTPKFSTAVAVSPKNDVAVDSRPQIVTGGQNIYIGWTQSSGNIGFSHSADGGKTFSAPLLLDHMAPAHAPQQGTPHLDALALTADGKLWAAWSKVQAIYLSVSNDQGENFGVARMVADSAWACGGITLQPAADHHTVALWRQSFEGAVRDHAIARIAAEGPIHSHRATFGGASSDTCPQPAPALAKGGDWGWHMAWFGGGQKPGIFYARMDGDAWVSSPPKRFAMTHAQASQPSLLAIGEHVWLAWKQPDPQGVTVNIATSDDGGRNWSSPVITARAEGESDEPVLLKHGEQAYLSWNAAAGYKLLPLP